MLRALGALTAAVVLVAAAQGTGQPHDPALALPAVWAAADCGRCHTVPDQPEYDRLDSCSTCHLWIRKVADDPSAREETREVFPRWDRHQRNPRSYLLVPALEPAMTRLEPSWVRAWLSDPYDIRPGLPEGMPRFDLSEQQLDVLEAAFAEQLVEVPATPSPDPANVETGRALIESRGCLACHGFGAIKPVPGFRDAPDLARTRDRMSPDRTVAWIIDPLAFSPKATMPPRPVTPDDAVALRDFLYLADPAAATPPPAPPPPEPTTEPVTWGDVEERVFGRVCVYCHMDPAQNEGRAGPGNAAGFGWAATGIELQTPEGVAAQAEAVAASMLRRRDEARRDHVGHGLVPAVVERPELPGMPLGLPAIPDEDIALVLGWIEQGMPR